VRITVLVENRTAAAGLRPEHGLSFWIECDGRRILFDTGAGGALGHNAAQLGVELSTADAIVLSHGHYDHTGGLAAALAAAPGAEVVAHPHALLTRYSLHPGKPPRPVGIPAESEAVFGALPVAQVTWSTGPLALSETVHVTGPIPRLTEYEDVGGPFFLDADGRVPDPLADDQALWIDTPQGLVVCLGCGHAGVVNTLDYVRELSGDDRLVAVLGGFHLLQAGAERLARTVEALQALQPRLLAPSHCTGEHAVERLREVFGTHLASGEAGTVLEW